jgi:hypothetical protein
LQASLEYDEEMTKFMADKLTPKVAAMFNEGAGAKTQTNCFSCHPVE